MSLLKNFTALSLAASAFIPSLVSAHAIGARQLPQVVTSCVNPNQVAVTFDDGPFEYLQDISDAFSARGAKATFFFNGNNYACIYDDGMISRIRHAYEAGHQIASHSWGHKDLATLSWDQVHDEMWRVEEALIRIIGANPAFMRPPFGSYNDNVRRVSEVRGQTVVNWDFDSGDSMGASAQESKNRYSDTANRRPSNILALNHETHASTAYEVVPHLLDTLLGAGYQLVTVAECLNMPAYQWTAGYGNKDGNWHC